MNIVRVDSYKDSRFSRTVLNQHGAYLVNDSPYEIEIKDPATAIVRGKDPTAFTELIENFRFHAPQIIHFFDSEGKEIADYPAPEILSIRLDDIQPSQFYIDRDKLDAVGSFVHTEKDIIIQVIPWEDRYISLDGHTRLYLAVQKDFQSVRAVMSETDEWVWKFVNEAQRRKIYSPGDMILLSHEEYDQKWNKYCDSVFEEQTVQ